MSKRELTPAERDIVSFLQSPLGLEIQEAGKEAFINRNVARMMGKVSAVLSAMPEIETAIQIEERVMGLCALIGNERGQAVAQRVFDEAQSSQWALLEIERLARKAAMGEEVE